MSVLYGESTGEPQGPNRGMEPQAQNELLSSLLLGARIVGVERGLPTGRVWATDERPLELTLLHEDGRRLRVDLAGYGYDASGLDVDVTELEPAKPIVQELRMPVCPECGERALTISVGVVLVERIKGERAETARPAPGAPPRYQCPEGHWFIVEGDGHHAPCGPPEEVTVLHEPRR